MLELAINDPAWRAAFAAFAADRTGLAADRVSQVVETCAAEVAVGLALVEAELSPSKRILEVGAGIGLLSHFLYRCGYDIVALEPGASGFGDSARIGSALQAYIGGPSLRMLDREASGLSPDRDGYFDVIFSVNVLEHIPDLERNLAAMVGVLAPGGVMLHSCPNYNVPYEPHYAMPLIPALPKAAAWIRPRLRQEELWRSLNFITTGRIRKICRHLGLNVRFREGVLYETLMRIETDPEFSARHPAAFRGVLRLLRRTGLIALLRHLPASMATPMTFRLTRQVGRPS